MTKKKAPASYKAMPPYTPANIEGRTQWLAENIEQARQGMELRAAEIRDLARIAAIRTADEVASQVRAFGDDAAAKPGEEVARTPEELARVHHARKILADLGARVLFEDIDQQPARFRTDPERAIAERLPEIETHERVLRLATSRRDIGAQSREWAREAAERYRGKLSKKNAAARLANTAPHNLSASRIEKLLTELFPGSSWKSPQK